MNNFIKLCHQIELPCEVIEKLQNTTFPFDQRQLDLFVDGITNANEYANTWQQIKEYDGFVQLKLMLTASLKTWQTYQKLDIDEQIFVDTIKCFTRFVGEHKQSYGYYNFDRGFWVGRQLSALLFRIGELEYELFNWEGEKVISIHIPSDCDLAPHKLDVSFEQARKFFQTRFESHANARFFCYSWLVSPNLKLVLPPTSKIVLFQNRFDVVKCLDDSQGFVQWVFKDKNLTVENYPENTTLQRNIKKHILAGGKIGEGIGYLKE